MTNATITHKAIAPFSIGGAGAGNTYRFEVTRSLPTGEVITTVSTCERDVASSYELAGFAVPAELQGEYDCFGNLNA